MVTYAVEQDHIIRILNLKYFKFPAIDSYQPSKKHKQMSKNQKKCVKNTVKTSFFNNFSKELVIKLAFRKVKGWTGLSHFLCEKEENTIF